MLDPVLISHLIFNYQIALKDLVTILNVLNLHLDIVFCNYESDNTKDIGIKENGTAKLAA